MEAFYVEFPNDDVGPFRTRDDAELYWLFEGNLDETQVFTTDKHSRSPWINPATFYAAVGGLAYVQEVVAMREP